MINIDVFSARYVEIESEQFNIHNQEDMVKFLKYLLNKVHYGGEKICLEKVTQDVSQGKNNYEFIGDWE